MKYLLSLIFLISCSSYQPTPYKERGTYDAEKKRITKYGYYFEKEDGFETSIFKGNSQTTNVLALKYATLGALKKCETEKKKLRVVKSLDESITDQRIGSYSGHGYFVGDLYVAPQARYYTYKINYPVQKISFSCRDYEKKFSNAYEFKVVDAVLIKRYTKDFLEALLVTSKSGNDLNKGDVLVSIDGKRIASIQDYIKALDTQKEKVKVSYIRDDRKRTKTIALMDNTEKLVEHNNKMKNFVCDKSEEIKDYKKVSFDALRTYCQ